MNKRFVNFASLVTCSLLVGNQLIAQDEISGILKTGLSDINKFGSLYLEPAGRGLSSGLGSNWYNTAAPHKLYGFDITAGASVAFIPSSLKSFNIDNNTFTNLKPSSGHAETAPTFSGSGDGVQMDVMANGSKVTTITTPSGVGDYGKYIPMANLQIGFGLPFRTELMVRLIPKQTFDDLSVKQFGIGIKHDFKQWIPVVKRLPFDASVVLAYSRFKVNYKFSDPLTPNDLGYTDPSDLSAYQNQNADMKVGAFTMNVVVSKKLMFFTPYLGFGFTQSKFTLGMKGTYPILDNENTSSTFNPNYENPVTITYKTFQPGATVGFRLKILWVLAFHAQYTLQKYPVASAGFGINIR
jgi:hypothetical protein